MYKVDYYTLAKCDDGSIGNVRQYSDTYYTDMNIEEIQKQLQYVIDIRKGDGKYVPVITKIEFIKGHLNR
jgi:predicted  nucleic acid-binding Zn-ribbon protein